jgi:hypothetical protein
MNENNLRLVLNHSKFKKDEEDKTVKTLNDCMDLFLEKEYLDGEDQQIKCEYCKLKQNFYKEYSIDRVPPVLTITLKRFKYVKMIRKKLDTMINFPLNDFEIKGEKYDLYGVINHYGSLQSGHYTSIIRQNQKWITCDDSRCFEVKESEIVSPMAYILVYRAKNSDEFSYLNMMRNILIRLKESNQNNECSFYPDEPVSTIYGKGFVVKGICREGVTLVKVKFKFGFGVLKYIIISCF